MSRSEECCSKSCPTTCLEIRKCVKRRESEDLDNELDDWLSISTPSISILSESSIEKVSWSGSQTFEKQVGKEVGKEEVGKDVGKEEIGKRELQLPLQSTNSESKEKIIVSKYHDGISPHLETTQTTQMETHHQDQNDQHLTTSTATSNCEKSITLHKQSQRKLSQLKINTKKKKQKHSHHVPLSFNSKKFNQSQHRHRKEEGEKQAQSIENENTNIIRRIRSSLSAFFIKKCRIVIRT